MGESEEQHADERLTPEQIAGGGLLAATHVQRYELAVGLADGKRVLDLCCGTGYGSTRIGAVASTVVGVDISTEALEHARALAAHQENVTFVAADAAEHLERVTADDVDLVVCFEGIEHVPDPDRVADSLARLAAGGVAILLSVPNSAGFEEDNEFHATDFAFASSEALVRRITDDAVRLDQTHGDAAVLLPAGERELPDSGTAVFDTDRLPDETVVTHWLYAVNVDRADLDAVRLRIAVTARPHHYGYMVSLERANRELWATNQRMARSWVGVHDAAAGRAARFRGELRDLKEERDSLIERLESAVESARLNDQMFQEARLMLLQREQELRRARLATVPYRAARKVYRRVKR